MRMPQVHRSGGIEQRIPPTRTPVVRAATMMAGLVALWVGLLALNRASRRVVGGSMRPALDPGEFILVLSVRSRQLRRGDVVVVRDPRYPSRETVKRVVGLPGEHVTVRCDRLEVAGIPYDEPYVRHEINPKRVSQQSVAWTVPPRHVVVLGDDRGWSTDSRVFGPVPDALVVGRVAARLRPPGSAPHLAPRPLL